MRTLARGQKGSQTIEFAAALTLLVTFILIPWIDISVILMRWMMAHEMISASSRELAFCETFGQSCKNLQAQPALKNRLTAIGGVDVQSMDLQLRIARVRRTSDVNSEEVFLVTNPGQIPPAWLPDGAKAPCTYSLLLKVNFLMSPAWLLSGVSCSIPGLTVPVPLSITILHEWENLGKNPISGRFFVNE